MTIIPFKPKTNNEHSPLDALKIVMEGIQQEDTKPERLLIIWNEQAEDGVYKLRYLLGGDDNLAAVVGLLELAKNDLMTD